MEPTKLSIDKEFQKLIPPLQANEYRQLEENILAEGCREPLIAWEGIIVDGHNRYKICTEHDIPFRVSDRQFKDRDTAKIWIIKNQFGRRNLIPFQRSELALVLKPLIRAKAKERQAEFFGNQHTNGLSQKNEKVQPIHTDEELAKLAGVSRATIRHAEKIITDGTPEQKKRAYIGGTGNTVSAIYNEVVNKGLTERKCSLCGEVLPIDRFVGGRKMCKLCASRRKGVSGADIKFIENVVDEVRSLIPCEYTTENLSEDLSALNADFIKKVKNALNIHEDLLSTEEGRKKAIAALSEAETAIRTIRGAVHL